MPLTRKEQGVREALRTLFALRPAIVNGGIDALLDGIDAYREAQKCDVWEDEVLARVWEAIHTLPEGA